MNAPDEEKLQAMLNVMSEWCKKWRMVVNTDKTQIVHFRSPRSSKTRYNFVFDNCGLEIVSEYKYLGVYFDEHMTFKCTASALSDSASRALGALRYRLKFLKECRLSTFTTLYTSCICPILDYGAAVWGTKVFENIEQIQYRAIRYFFGVHRLAPINMLQGDMGWISCLDRHKLCTLRLWNRLLSLPPDRISSHIFLWDLNFSSKPGSWSYHIKCIFEELNSIECYNDIQPCDVDNAYQAIKGNREAIWNQERYHKPKLRYYNAFKPDYCQEEYLNLNISKYQRSVFAQFRADILPLQVEVCRFRNLPLEERLCTLCNQAQVEDEFHVLYICDKYSDLRTVLYDQARHAYNMFATLDNLDKFVFLVSNLQKYVIDFLTGAMQRRRNYLFR